MPLFLFGHTNPCTTTTATLKGIQKLEFALIDISLRLGRLMSKRQCSYEMSSLSTTGRSATFMGVLGTLQAFGIVSMMATPAPEDPLEGWVHLGQGSQKIVTKTTVASKFCKDFKYDVAIVKSVEDLKKLSEDLEMRRAGSDVPELKFGGGYLWPHVVRKVVMGAIAAASSQGDGSTLSWYTVSKELLLKVVPDENNVLKAFPDDWTVGEIGEMVFGDSEQGFYASCWGCLFQAPIEAWPGLIEEMHALFKNNVKFQLAWQAVRGDIVAPTPMNLISEQLPFKSIKRVVKSTKRARQTSQDSEKSRCSNAGLATPAAMTRGATLATKTARKASATKAARRINRRARKGDRK